MTALEIDSIWFLPFNPTIFIKVLQTTFPTEMKPSKLSAKKEIELKLKKER